MSKLAEQLQRLFGLPDLAPADLLSACSGGPAPSFDLADSTGAVRVMLIGIERPGDWASVAALYQGLQEDLDLPAPALSISARAGFQVWLVLAGPVPAGLACAFLHALRRKYLAEIPVDRVRLHPAAADGAGRVSLVPAFDEASGKWSAFIDPGMGSLFVAEPGLDMAPNPDRQADMLAGIECMAVADFQRALARLAGDDAGETEAARLAAMTPAEILPVPARPALLAGQQFADPRSFLLAVMNDPAASTKQRIRAARALLPYF